MPRILRIFIANLVLITILTLLSFVTDYISIHSRVIPVINVPRILNPYNFFITLIGKLFSYVPLLLIISFVKIQKPVHHSIIYLLIYMIGDYLVWGASLNDDFIQTYFTLTSVWIICS